MTETDHAAVQTGEARARARQRRVWTAMAVPGLIGLVILQGSKYALGAENVRFGGPIDPTFAVIVAAVIPLATLIGAIWHHRVIDEQEERAVLWANTVGFYSFIVAAMVAEVLAWGGLVRPVSHAALLVICFIPALATYAWQRFR